MAFWIMKILATTLGETAGDFISMTLNLGYYVGFGITFAALLVILVAPISARKFYSPLFWLAIVATTTAGTEISDMIDRSFGLGYLSGSIILTLGLAISLGVWYLRDAKLDVVHVNRRDTETLFWIAVVFSNSLGTAFGDFLTKPIEKGGLNLPRDNASLVTLGLPGRCPDAVHVEAAIKDGRPAGVVPRQSNGCRLCRRISPAQFCPGSRRPFAQQGDMQGQPRMMKH
nr:hypothetical protein [Ensifer sp. ENS09]